MGARNFVCKIFLFKSDKLLGHIEYLHVLYLLNVQLFQKIIEFLIYNSSILNHCGLILLVIYKLIANSLGPSYQYLILKCFTSMTTWNTLCAKKEGVLDKQF